MLQFFRKLRQKLLAEGKLRKYLVYALGEILLVMIGILLALQVNNWNETRKNRTLQVKYLNDIQEELVNNQRLMERLVLNRVSRKIEGLQKVKSYANNSYEVKDTLAFLLDASFGAVFGNGIEFLNSSIFEELKNTGNIQLLSNDSLKLQILNYYHFVDKQILNVRYYVSDYQKMINGHKVFNRSEPDYISAADQIFMMRKLKSNEVIILANQEMTYGHQVNYLIKGIHQQAKEIVDAIEIEKQHLK